MYKIVEDMKAVKSETEVNPTKLMMYSAVKYKYIK